MSCPDRWRQRNDSFSLRFLPLPFSILGAGATLGQIGVEFHRRIWRKPQAEFRAAPENILRCARFVVRSLVSGEQKRSQASRREAMRATMGLTLYLVRRSFFPTISPDCALQLHSNPRGR